ncbi:MAG: hypothetical protein Q8M76_03645, partial [Spirochaetaceae bacterium]|nr:hypothetical protein [Spirochaetaceae bacterium]
EVVALCDRIVAAAREAGVPCGASIGPGDKLYIEEWIRRGIDFLSCGDELSFMAAGAAETIGFIRGSFEGRAPTR